MNSEDATNFQKAEGRGQEPEMALISIYIAIEVRLSSPAEDSEQDPWLCSLNGLLEKAMSLH